MIFIVAICALAHNLETFLLVPNLVRASEKYFLENEWYPENCNFAVFHTSLIFQPRLSVMKFFYLETKHVTQKQR